MTSVFLRLCNMGITASWLVLGLLLIRPLIRKVPKWVNCLLWGIVAVRLLLPVSPVSKLSLLPSVQPIPTDITSASIPQVQTGITAVNRVTNPVLEKVNDLGSIFDVLTIIWLVGVAAMLLYSAVSYFLLRRKVASSILVAPGVYVCDYVDMPFVLGVFRPRIYLPSNLQGNSREVVLAHEQAHLRRHDHWWKPLAYTLLSVYWFNPLLWVAYILLCRDIETACDEKVVKTMELKERKTYSLALAECSCQRHRILACPVAFGEVGVKGRIRAVLSYKKPTFWIIVASVVLCVVAAVCFLTEPNPCQHLYTHRITTAATCSQEGVCTYTCKHCEYRYTEPVAMLAHTYGEGKVITQPDCIQPGLAKHTCIDCGHIGKLEIGTNDAHQYVGKETKASTCTKNGELTETCTLCGDTKVSALPLAEHHYALEFTQEATCVRTGMQRFGCTQCDKEYYTELPKTSHTWTGKSTIYCTGCGWVKRDGRYAGKSIIGDSPSLPYPQYSYPGTIRWDYGNNPYGN